MEADNRGHCHFAYPLYTTTTHTASKSAGRSARQRETTPCEEEVDSDRVEYDVYSPENDLALLDSLAAEEMADVAPVERRKTRTLVTFQDYFSSCLLGDMQPTTEVTGHSHFDSGDSDQEMSEREKSHSDNDDPPEYDSDEAVSSTSEGSEVNWNGVINSAGRQALGCMLGMSGMPTVCRSYPVAPELSQADFWHVRRVFWRDRLSEMRRSVSATAMNATPGVNSSLADEANQAGRRLAPGWQLEENYVVVHAPACEGFRVAEDVKKSIDDGMDVTPIRHGVYVGSLETPLPSVENESQGGVVSETFPTVSDKDKQAAVATDSSTRTLRDFVGDTLLDRWEESQWFLAMIEDISVYLPIGLVTNKQVMLVFVNQLAQIWYNFDSLKVAKTRPFKTYRRLKRDIESLTWALVKTTKGFLESAEYSAPTCDDMSPPGRDIVEVSYRNLLDRLGIA